MSIQIITGVPGSGKSYYAVYQINRLLSSDNGNFVIITNIDTLRINDARLLKIEFSIDFFKNSHQEVYLRDVRNRYNLDNDSIVYYFIDEAQRFVTPDLKDTDVVYFFDYHRHYGLEIYLVTQDIYKISKKVSVLSDCEIRAVSTKVNPLPCFYYNLKSADEKFDSVRLKRDKKIFSLYKSFESNGIIAKNTKTVRLIVVFVVLMVFFAFLFRYAFNKNFSIKENKPNQKIISVQNSTIKHDNSIQKSLDLPKIVKHDGFNNIFFYDSRLRQTMKLSLRSFLDRYPPFVYGYSIIALNRDMVIVKDQVVVYPYQRKLDEIEIPPPPEGASKFSLTPMGEAKS